MKRLKPKYLYYLAGLIILGITGIQLYWITNNISLQKTDLERRLKEDIGNVVKEVEEDAYCFSYNSKAFIKKGEGLYIVKQKWENDRFKGPENGGYIDTLDLYNVFYYKQDTTFENGKTVTFSNYEATVDISMKFTLFGMNPHIKRRDSSSYNLVGLNNANFKDLLADKIKVDEAVDMSYMDSLIKDVLKKNKLDNVFEAGIRRVGKKDYEYLFPGSSKINIEKGTIKAVFLDNNRFNKPYELILYVPDSYSRVIQSLSLMIGSSLLIILILIVSYLFFVRTILKQNKLSEMKNTFINNITHEFRTPITNINLAIENSRELNRSNDRYLDIIEAENKLMARNVQYILQLAMMEDTTMHIALSKVNVEELISNTVSYFQIQLENLKGRIVCKYDAQSPFLYADKEQLQILICNLVDNAIKYSPASPDITISTFDSGSRFAIQVADKGIGMDKDTQKYIFNRFYRANTGDRHDVKGFGLGLSYVKHIIEVHDGEIQVKSRPGAGTKITIYLPKNLNERYDKGIIR